jgi:3-hydroxyisobutyrate dehydrogenase
MSKIAFIGLGVMGLPMAQNLVARGHDVTGADLSGTARAKLVEVGGKVCLPDQLDLAGIEIVLTMLPSGAIVKSVFDDVILPRAEAGTLVIDCSSIDLDTTKQIAEEGTAKGLIVLDSPVSGGPEAAGSGKLSLMVGASAEAYEKAQSILSEIGAKMSHFGDNGAGQVAKACHNMIVGITALGVYEGFALAKACGLDAAQFYELCNGAAAQSWVLHNRCPEPGVVPAAPASHDYAPGFAAGLMSKDLGLAQAAAKSAKLDTPFGAEAAERFAKFCEDGNAGYDFSAIFRTIQANA